VTRNHHRRAAFTLIELLVVLAILAILSAMIAVAVGPMRKDRLKKQTDDVLFKVQKGIDVQINQLMDQARDDRRKNTPEFQRILAYCDGDADRAMNLLGHLKVRHAFPQTFAEATSNVTLPGNVVNWPPHKAYASFAGATAGTATADQQSAALLHAGLSKMAAGGMTFDADEVLAAAQLPNYTVGSTTVTVFKDSWGTPVGFSRFLEEPMILNQPPYANLKDTITKNPFDPEGKLRLWSPTPANKKTNAETALGTVFNENNKVITPFSYGQDKTPGTGDEQFGYYLRQLGGKSQ
jgi:prepilin-type N-terminal cleavage/methylation domain-containing protein